MRGRNGRIRDRRLFEVEVRCCPTDKDCGDDGMPSRCPLDCAVEYVPFVSQCANLLSDMVGEGEMASFDAVQAQCEAGSPLPALTEEVQALQDRGCVVQGFQTIKTAPGAQSGPGHRRVQGLAGLHHHVTLDKCAWNAFQQRVDQVPSST
jgi:hypothetical protein